MKFNLTMLPLDIVVASAFVSSKDKKNSPSTFLKHIQVVLMLFLHIRIVRTITICSKHNNVHPFQALNRLVKLLS